jgi:hypothetical protein
MTTISRRVGWSLAAAALVLVIACVVAFLKLRHQGAPEAPPDPAHVPATWEQFRTSAGHKTHLTDGKTQCSDCHDFNKNGFKNPGTAVCAKCHAKEAAGAHHGPTTGSGACLTCHTFAPGGTVQTCIDCHQSPQGNLAAVVHHATVDCSTCHHLAETPSLVLADCTGCHAAVKLKHQTMGPARETGSHGCDDCHHGHEPASAAKTVCTSCHNENKQPHPLAHDACISCHQPHDFAATDSTCVSCHGHKRTLADHAVPAHAACLSCHNPHVPNSAASACDACHSNMQVNHTKGAACTTCHVLHGADPHSTGGLDAGLLPITRDFGK